MLISIISFYANSQECNPIHRIPKYELSSEKTLGVGYVSCFHAKALITEVGYKNFFGGFVIVGKGHHSNAYMFLSYEIEYERLLLYAGPALRINNDPSILIGRFGIDYRLIKSIYATGSVIQVSRNLNYAYIGVKINY